ncbi:type II restriction endonuclease [Neisseria meningitidis]|nr:HNH endonuclease [Neisseria meningitidis]EOB87321.1 HNH endonuclease family protein [Neisseria meningitidis NM604]AOT28593.1 restriction endonuclease [Neisseria meningitidis]EJU65937.1 putative type II restriction endonuclease [Neisseria meningitidis 69166]ELK65657.1 HNH endonuclease family protein [Neisseria meningitidis 68094]ELK67204.1 HNH endonuclease family protein [Neisseria meningitidis 88050]
MPDFQRITIENIEYFIVDSIQNLRAEDSFIHRNNKLSVFGGNGEARKYVGSYIDDSGRKLSTFFEYENWGITETKNGRRVEYPLIQKNCFFNKKNLQRYLVDAKVEYHKQEQKYHHDISRFYDDYVLSINNLPTENIFFSIHDVSDHLENSKGYRRGYIRSEDDIWSIWRKIVLPKISYLSILKLLPVKDIEDSEPLFYFRIFLDYQFRSIVHPQLLSREKLEIPASEFNQFVEQEIIKQKSRKGQQKYRKDVINHMPQCPFTLITDEILLRASHIKPYMVCITEKNEKEALDYLNGLALTPTYDWLFDQGYITFLDDGRLICGTRLSRYTWEKLNINPNAKNKMRIYPEGREKYLEYHRKFVFQDNIDDFL